MNFSASNKSVDLEKPRRLEEETAIYLSGLEPQLEDAESNDNIALLVDNVLDEIKQRTASAASDRRTNFIIEKICNFSNMNQLMEVMKRCTPYVLFLSQNRHSSHVIQSIVARLCHLLRAGETYDVDLELLESVILTFVEPILTNFAWMAGEISGSHVLRSMICLLTGMPLISERKGSSSKHQHSVARSEPLEKLIVPDLFYIDSQLCFQVPDAFHSALYTAVESSLLGQTDSDGNTTGTSSSFSHELQLMISDTSCCAAVVILLRILFTPDLIPEGPELAEQIAMCALDWSAPRRSSSGPEADVGANVFYAMGGDKSGSYFLEAVIECCSVSFLIDMAQRCLISRSDETIQEFVEDDVGNFIIQSVMKRITSVFTLNSKKATNIPEYDDLMELSKKILSNKNGLLRADIFTYLVQCKGGVVLWMLKLGKAMSTTSDTYNSDGSNCLGHEVASRVLAQWTRVSTDDVEAEDFIAALDTYMVRRFEVATVIEETKSNDKKPSKNAATKAASNKPNAAALLVARLLGAILSLDGSAMAGVVCRMLCRLPHETLLNISCSGPMSRSVLDVFFESKSNGRERSIFLTSFLMPNLKMVCSHAIAHHTLRKCFESASSIDKERVVEAIVVPSFYETIAHSREGKAVVRFTQCDLYARNISEWKALIVRQKKAQAMLVELENVTTAPHQKSGNQDQNSYVTQPQQPDYFTSNYTAETSVDNDNGTIAAGGRKRKRKRTSSKKEEAADDDSGEVVETAATEENGASFSDAVIDNIFGDSDSVELSKKKSSHGDDASRFDHSTGEGVTDSQSEKKAKKHKKSKKSSQHSGYDKPRHGSSSHTGGSEGKVDFQKIKLLNSAKMMSIKKLTENL